MKKINYKGQELDLTTYDGIDQFFDLILFDVKDGEYKITGPFLALFDRYFFNEFNIQVNDDNVNEELNRLYNFLDQIENIDSIKGVMTYGTDGIVLFTSELLPVTDSFIMHGYYGQGVCSVAEVKEPGLYIILAEND
jgi:hypothetical protein